MLNCNSLLSALLMLILLSIGYWLYNSNFRILEQKNQPMIQDNTDYYLMNTTITQYNKTGVPDYILTANKITHYAHNDTTVLQTPHLKSVSNLKNIMVVDALNGKLLPGNQNIELWDEVVIIQTNLQDNIKIRIDTDFITIYSESGLAVTNRPVLITSNIGQTKAIGMEAYYKENLVKLRSKVRCFYEAQKTL